MEIESIKEPQSVYAFTVKDAKGNDVDLSIYKGKVLLIWNDQFKLHGTESVIPNPYKIKFGEEEPGSNDQILEFVCTHFKSEYPIFDKIEVNGENAAPLYKFLKLGKWGIIGDDIQWNFAKFLVDKNGQAVDRYYPTTSPLTIERDVKQLLGIL
ncbi:hypothetical protein TEA_010563 [Camellia sinensis var. sinensis]|uniref:Glutathione peroxidase n=1 Tax=Camellia sinensis var. sinensis TaxID=542762 RepID=A0A4S4EJ02_CAMSN|nr:hypothetical protein TEA_010563 [Camellia sinensis var. sinensis]